MTAMISVTERMRENKWNSAAVLIINRVARHIQNRNSRHIYKHNAKLILCRNSKYNIDLILQERMQVHTATQTMPSKYSNPYTQQSKTRARKLKQARKTIKSNVTKL